MDTETPHPAADSDEAGIRHICSCERPGGSRKGHKSVQSAADRRSAVVETAGALAGLYEPGYLKTLREDWPD